MMNLSGSTRLIGIFGDPIAHSLSPAMHNPAFVKYGLDFAYVPLQVKPPDLEKAVDALRLFNFRGANITLPHKQKILPYLDEVSEISRLMGAVNTVVNEDGKLFGTTTDAEGFLMGFHEAGHRFLNRTVAILGNGGSARTLIFALLVNAKLSENNSTEIITEADKPARIFLFGRDADKTNKLVAEIKSTLKTHGIAFDPQSLEAKSLDQYSQHKSEIDIVINATPVGMKPNFSASPLSAQDLVEGQIVYDIVYTPEQTQLLRDANARGLKTVGGLGMLVHQGRASFKLWTGILPEAADYYASARKQLL